MLKKYIIINFFIFNLFVFVPAYGDTSGITPAPADRHWKAPVSSSADLPPTASIGDTRIATNTNSIYTFNGTIWIESTGINGLRNVDGGLASSIYLTSQIIDGGAAAW